MKKHRIPLTIFAIAAITIFALMIGPKKPIIPTHLKTDLDEITAIINKIDTNLYNQNDVDLAKTKLQALKNLGEINDRNYKAKLVSLEISIQNSLTNSITDWLINDCGKGNIKEIIRLANSYEEKNATLIKAISVYDQYKIAVSFSFKLKQFLAGYFTDEGSNKLIAGYKSTIDGQPFRKCSIISDIKVKINLETDLFRNFINTYNIKIGDPKSPRKRNPNYSYYDDPEQKNKLNKYNYYLNYYNNLLNDPN